MSGPASPAPNPRAPKLGRTFAACLATAKRIKSKAKRLRALDACGIAHELSVCEARASTLTCAAKAPRLKGTFKALDASQPAQLAIVVDASLGHFARLRTVVAKLVEETMSGLPRGSRVSVVLATPRGKGTLVFANASAARWVHLVRTFQIALRRGALAAPQPGALPAAVTNAREQFRTGGPQQRYLVVVTNGLGVDLEAYGNVNLPLSKSTRKNYHAVVISVGAVRHAGLSALARAPHVDYVAWSPRGRPPLLFTGHYHAVESARSYGPSAALRLRRRGAKRANAAGAANVKRGNLAQAYREYRRALQLDPRNVDARRSLGVVQARMGDVGGALRTVEWLRRNSGEGEAEVLRRRVESIQTPR